MKKIIALALAVIPIAVNVFAFIDKTALDKEEVLRKLNELRVVKGMFISGKAWFFFNPTWGFGSQFTNMGKKMDFDPTVALHMDMTAFPLPMVEIGARLKIKRSQAHGTEITADNLYSEFILFRFILLRLGQISEKFTPFTLQSYVDQVQMRSELLNTYYLEDLYNNLIPTDGSVPMEGIKVKFDLGLGDGAFVGFKGIAAKVLNDGTKGNSYDRYLGGAYLSGQFMKKAIGVEGTYMIYRDNTNSGNRDPNPGKSYMIYSGTASLDAVPLMNLPILESLGVQAELAGSRTREDLSSSNLPVYGSALQGNFYATIKQTLNLKAGYRQIAYEFVSPGAQSRFVTPDVAGSSFQNYGLFNYLGLDPFLFQNLFRSRVQFTRDNNNVLNYVESMNVATPNRQGIFADLNFNYKDWAAVSASGSKMQEIRPLSKPNLNLRDFLRVQAEASVSLAKIIGLAGLPKLSGFYIMENDSRSDSSLTALPLDETENFRLRVFGGEVTVDLKVIKFVATYQQYGLFGKKIVDNYNNAMQESLAVYGYQPLDFGTSGRNESLIGGGVIIRISQAVMMQLDGFWLTHGDTYNLLQSRAFINARF